MSQKSGISIMKARKGSRPQKKWQAMLRNLLQRISEKGITTDEGQEQLM
jgi:hypothetical protein